ncbi:MAG: hypothetical protein RLZZ584_295 [Pseudomonadota bacterium]
MSSAMVPQPRHESSPQGGGPAMSTLSAAAVPCARPLPGAEGGGELAGATVHQLPDRWADRRSVTFLFTDIEGSTRLWEQRPAAMQTALRRHDELAHQAVAAHGGRIIKMTGDGLHAAFAQPLAAVQAARDFCLALGAASRDGLPVPLLARCGLHLGYDEQRGGDFFGRDVNRAARIMQCAHGGQILMSAAVAARVGAALAGDAGAAVLDLGLVRLRDLSEPERVHQLLHPALRAQFPALRTLASTPNNLAQQLNSFVGRERELAQAQAQLARSRLLTLVGLGGIGKTRLAMQLAAQVLDDYPDGVWFVELAPLADPQLVPQAVATVLGVKEEAGQGVTEALTRFVADRRLLVTFDNCEHVVQACADLAGQLLRAGAGVKLLATSREALQIGAESLYAVPPLGVPGHRRVPTVAEVVAEASVQLFADRVRAVQPDFRVDTGNALQVAAIVRQLDGLPLALELAAARVRQMTVAQLAERIADRFRLLRNGDRCALPRQQTLRALIDWSHDLLSPDERVLFRRLSVFAGGWTLEVAEAVCGQWNSEFGACGEVLDLLGALVDKSLVSLDRERGRYRMLETVRQYAQHKLADAGEAGPLRRAHLLTYLQQAERLRAGLGGPEQGACIEALDLERENLLACHAACDQEPDGADLGVRLASALRRYCIDRGLLGLGLRLATDALLRLPASRRDAVRCNALFDIGQLCYFTGHYARARGYLEEVLVLACELGDRELEFDVSAVLGTCLMGLEEPVAAESILSRSYRLARELGQDRRLALATNCLAQCHRTQSRWHSAIALNEECYQLSISDGDQHLAGVALLNLVMLHVECRQAPGALRRLVQAAALDPVQSSPFLMQSLFEAATGVAVCLSAWGQARRCMAVAKALSASNGLQCDPADEDFLNRQIEAVNRALGEQQVRHAVQDAAHMDLDLGDLLFELQVWLDQLAPMLVDERPAPRDCSLGITTANCGDDVA